MSDMTTAQALAEAGKWGNLIRSLSKLSEVAEYLHAQSQLDGERKTRLAALQSDIDAAKAHLDEVRSEAQDIIDAAKAAAAKMLAESSDAVAWARKEQAEVQAQSSAARAAADVAQDDARQATAEAAAARDELKRVRANIEAAKADALKRIGG